MLAYWDRSERCLFANEAYRQWFGLSAEKLAALPLLDLVGPEIYAQVKPLIDGALAGTPQRFERARADKDGKMRHWLVFYLPDTRDGEVKGFLTQVTEITDLHELREEKERRTKELALLVDLLPVGVSMLDDAGTVLQSNTALRKIMEIEPGAEKTFRQRTFIHPDGTPFAPEDLPKTVAIREQRVVGPTEIGVANPDGSTVWVSVTAAPVPSSGAALVLTRDITRERENTAALKKGAARSAAIIDSSPVPLALNDEGGSITYLNAAFAATFGYTHDDIPTLAAWWKRAYPDAEYRDRIVGEWGRRLDRARRTGAAFEPLEVEITAKNGDKKTVIGSAVSLAGAFEGEQLLVLFDVSERAHAEELRKELEGQLRQLQKMEAIGTFAGGLAHDFNNIMNAILGVAEVMLAENGGPTLTTDLHTIVDAAKRGAQLSRQILTLSRPAAFELRPLALGDVMREVARLLRAAIPPNITLEVNEAANLPSALADAGQVHQVLVNLCGNAVQAIGGRPGTVAVSLEKWRGTPTRGRPDADYVRMKVRDTGCGIPSDILPRIFDPFFTTKASGDGTGLGLSMVHTIMEAHSGAVTVETATGQGSTFHVYWPLAADAKPSKEQQAETKGAAPLHVLFVDDDATICKVAERWLKRNNCRVTTCTDPTVAVSRFTNDPNEFDVVITDLSMPNMNGLELTKQLQAVRAKIPVILATGNPGELTPEEVHARGIRELLHKPIPLEDLLHAVTRVASPSR